MSIDTIYLIHHTHTDIGFTHDQEVVFDLHRQFIDQAIDLCEQTADYPDGSALRWTCECTLTLLSWLKHRDDAQIQRFLKLEREGRIEATGAFATLSQCVSHEGLWRNLYPVQKLRKQYGMTVRSAMVCDINGYHMGVVDALSGSGINNFSMAINENVGRAAFGKTRPNGFYWESPAGNRVLVWNGLHYNNNQYFAIPDDYDRAVRELPRFLKWLEVREYPYSFCFFQATYNTFNDNGPVDPRLPDFVRRWNKEERTPRLEIVTLSQFYDKLRKESPELLPTHRGEWSDYWNVGATSTAYETLLNRSTERRLVEAEWLAAISSTGKEFSRKNDLNEGWELALLYDEHTWGSNVSSPQPWAQATRSQLNQKLGYAYRARSKAQLVRLEAVDRLAKSVGAKPGRYVLAINSLPWSRREQLIIPQTWLEGYSGYAQQLVLDEAAPREQVVGEIHDTVSRVHYMDRDDLGEQQSLTGSDALISVPVEVPSMGFRLLNAADLQASKSEQPKVVELARAENARFTVVMDGERGGISSLFDREQSREWIDPTAGLTLGAYVYEQIATATPDQPYGGRMQIYKESDWTRFMGYRGWSTAWQASRQGVQKVISQTSQRLPGATRLRQVCSAPGVNELVYEVTVYDDLSEVDLRIMLDKIWNSQPESCYLVFPFDLPGAIPRYEAVGGTVQPSMDQLPGTNQDFPTVQGWADWSNEQEGITLCTPDTPIMMFGGFYFGRMHDGIRPKTPATFVSMVMSNYYHVNYAPAQNGQVSFSYRLCPHGTFDPSWSSRRGREAASPLWGHPVKDPSGTREAFGSLLEVSHEAIDVTTIKLPEDGEGLILRLRNTSNAEAAGTLKLPTGLFKSAWNCDALENPATPAAFKDNALEITLPPFATLTYLLRKG